MGDLATLEELATFVGRTLTPAGSGEQPTTEEQALTIASSTVRTYLGHQVSLQEETYVLDGTGTTFLRLPGFPIIDIAAVEEDGEEVPAEAYKVSPTGYLLRTDGHKWTHNPGGIEITFTAGFDPVPAVIVGAVLNLAARISDGSANIKQETIGSYNVTYATPTPTLQAAEMMAIEPYRIRE